jgi:hypothetical protein
MLAERERGNSPANKDAKQSQRNIARRSRGQKTKDSLSDITHTSSSISRRFQKRSFLSVGGYIFVFTHEKQRGDGTELEQRAGVHVM